MGNYNSSSRTKVRSSCRASQDSVVGEGSESDMFGLAMLVLLLLLLLQVNLDNQHLPEHQAGLIKYNFNDDCPVFDGMFDYCRCADLTDAARRTCSLRARSTGRVAGSGLCACSF